jgi:hypothetical protein
MGNFSLHAYIEQGMNVFMTNKQVIDIIETSAKLRKPASAARVWS